MAARRVPGQPGRLVCWFRNLLIGRSMEATPWLRTLPKVSPRSPPPPHLPPGPAHKLAANYYCSRDIRRSVGPCTVTSSHQQQLTAAAQEHLSPEEVAYPQIVTPPTPGGVYTPDRKP